MASMDVPAGKPAAVPEARPVVVKPTYITWLTLAFMTTASVASLRSAPTMAVSGLTCVFLYLVPAIIFLLPQSLVAAELASGWTGGVFRWLPGMTGRDAQDALVAHLESRFPWNLHHTIERVAVGDPFIGSLDGPGFEAMKEAMEEAFGRPMTTEGQGGSIPLCNVLAETYPDAEIMLLGVEEPKCLIHAPNESVDPSEIENIALAEALFLRNYAT
jgi:hypothetical protein